MAFDSEIGNLFVRVSADTSGLVSGMETASAAISTLGYKNATASQKLTATGTLMSKTGGAILKGFTVPATVAGTMAVKAFTDYETAFTKVRKTVKATDKELDTLSGGIRSMAKEIPVSAAELATLAGTGGQLGIAVENIEEFTRVMADMGVATNLAGEEGASEMAKFVNIMGTSQKQFSNIGSSVVHLGNNMATTEADIMAMSMRLASTGNIVGMTEAEVLACAAAMSSTGIEAEAGGTAMSRTWTDIHTAVVQGGKALQEYARISGKSAEEFSAQWKEDAAGAFADFIRGLGQSENMLEELSQIGVDEVRQKNMLQSLAKAESQSGLLTKALELSNTAWEENVALTNEAETAYSTTANQLELAKNKITDIGITWGETIAPYLKEGADLLSDLTEKFAGLDEEGRNAFVETGIDVSLFAIGLKGAGELLKKAMGKDSVREVGKAFWEAIGGKAGVSAASSGLGSAFTAALPAVATLAGGLAAMAAPVGAMAIGMKEYGEYLKEASVLTNEEKQAFSDELSGWKDINSELDKALELREEYARLNEIILDRRRKGDDSEYSEADAAAAKTRIDEMRDYLKSLNIGEINKLNATEGNEYALFDAYVNAVEDKANKAVEDLKGIYDRFAGIYQQETGAFGVKMRSNEELSKLYYDVLQAASEYDGVIGGDDVLRDVRYEEWIERNTGLLEEYQRIMGTPLNLENIRGASDEILDRLHEQEAACGRLIPIAADAAVSMQKLGTETQQTLLSSYGYKDSWAVFEEGDAAVELFAGSLERCMESLGFSGTQIAQQLALFRQGFDSLDDVIANGSLDAYINDFISESQKMGAGMDETAVQAALLKNGFTDMMQAIQAGALPAVAADLTEIARSLGLIPEHKEIRIDAGGNIFEYSNILGEIDKSTVTVSVDVNADGTQELMSLQELIDQVGYEQAVVTITAQDNATAVIDNVEYRVLGVNEQNGNVVLYADDSHVLYVLDEATGALHQWEDSEPSVEVFAETNTAESNLGGVTTAANEIPSEKSVTVNANADEAVNKLKEVNNLAQDTTKTVTVTTAFVNGASVDKEATGTSYFRGGLALVNDQRGIADPRELIIDKGRAFIPEGRDVLLPLSKGAKVFTASRTKDILARAGVPAFANGVNVGSYWRDKPNGGRTRVKGYTRAAGGIDNEILDEFDEFYDTVQFNLEMDWINEDEYMRQLAEFRDANLTASGDTLEAWRTVTSELKQYEDETRANAISGLDEWHSAVADWNSYNVDMGRWSSEEQLAIMKNQDAEMLAMIKSTIAENNFTAEELEQIWGDYYDWKRDQEVDQYNLEKQLRRDALDEANALSEKYIADTSYFNTWSALGDTPIDAYWRYASRNQEALAAGDLTQEEYNDLMENIGSSMYSERLSDSKRWLSEQEKYYGMNTGEYLAGLDRMRGYTEEYYQKGIISAREYFDSMADIDGMYFDRVSEDYDGKLADFREQISELESYYSGVISDMQTDWNTQDRAEDMALIKTDMSEFAGAVTSAGRAEYERLADELKALEREEEIYQLQVKQEAILDELNQKYDFAEKEKAAALGDIAQNGFDITARMNNILSGLTAMTKSIDNYVSNVENSTSVVYNITAADGVDLKYILKGVLRL